MSFNLMSRFGVVVIEHNCAKAMDDVAPWLPNPGDIIYPIPQKPNKVSINGTYVDQAILIEANIEESVPSLLYNSKFTYIKAYDEPYLVLKKYRNFSARVNDLPMTINLMVLWNEKVWYVNSHYFMDASDLSI